MEAKSMIDEREVVLARLDALKSELELLHQKQKPDDPQAENPWYLKIVQYLGIPAALLALAIQYADYNSKGITDQKTQEEISSIHYEALNKKAELEKKLNDLEKERKANIDSSKISETLDKIRSTIAEIDKLQEAATKGALTRILMEFVIVSFVLTASSAVLDLINTLWGVSIYPGIVILQTMLYKRITNPKYRPWKGIIIPMFVSIFAVFPNFLRWYVIIFIVLNASYPVAYEASLVIGKPSAFINMVEEAQHRNLSKASKYLVDLLSVDLPN